MEKHEGKSLKSCVFACAIVLINTQILALKKSSSVEVEVGKELESVNTKFKLRDKSLIGLGFKILEKLKSMLRK